MSKFSLRLTYSTCKNARKKTTIKKLIYVNYTTELPGPPPLFIMKDKGKTDTYLK